jgi:hypothetical protein
MEATQIPGSGHGLLGSANEEKGSDEAKADQRISLCHVDRSRAAFARSAATKQMLTDVAETSSSPSNTSNKTLNPHPKSHSL